jgi:hypothetical protein
MISYESSNKLIKIWRGRWYLYAIFLYLKNSIDLDIVTDYLINDGLEDKENEKLKQDWKDIKRHVELTKMNKYS